MQLFASRRNYCDHMLQVKIFFILREILPKGVTVLALHAQTKVRLHMIPKHTQE